MSTNQPSSSQPRRVRGGKRAQRAKRSSQTGELTAQALTLLTAVKEQHLAEEYDPEGIWGISDEGRKLVDAASELLGQATAAGSAEAERANRRLFDFVDEENGWEYVTERAEGFLDEAIAELS